MCTSQLAIQGAGHLSAALIEGFCRAQITRISIHNRTLERALSLARTFPALRVFEKVEAFDAEECPLLLVIPGRALLQVPDVRAERLRRSGRSVVSCVNGLPLSLLEKRFPRIPWIKAIPSVAAQVGRSTTLIAKASLVTDTSFQDVRHLFERVGSVVPIGSEQEMDRLAVVTSCFPGMLAAMLDEFAKTFELTDDPTRELLLESALASIVLAQGHVAGLPGLVSSVANPGGLTEKGVVVIRRELPPVLAELRRALDRKREQRHRQYAV